MNNIILHQEFDKTKVIIDDVSKKIYKEIPLSVWFTTFCMIELSALRFCKLICTTIIEEIEREDHE